MPSVLHVEAFDDNYIWLIQGDNSAHVAIVDPGDAGPVFAFLEQHRLTPVAILCTHHHGDHVGGNRELLQRYTLPVYGPVAENIATVDHAVDDGDTVALPELGLELSVIGVPGHTRGHIAYYGAGMLFCGDTLFSAGCGRLFEGTAAQMYASLCRFAPLPPETRVYCAHEYTADNLRFALAVEPENADIRVYTEVVTNLRDSGRATLPSTLARERAINPFLRCREAAVQASVSAHAGQTLNDEVDVFTALRRWKDDYRG
ncbi:MAG: hydroxyacylglutathione hydrolase [Gammaproteobacteria bacterium]|nr:MAG: hydroxyacylglutathione hydrolase [Gammaproteobacteria bacterium]